MSYRVIAVNSIYITIKVHVGVSHRSTAKLLGPVVQSVVSLTSLLRVISLTVLADSVYNILIFFAEKMWVAFALQKLLTFFSKKYQHIWVSLNVNFNESLTNDVVSFEQLGPEFYSSGTVWIFYHFYPGRFYKDFVKKKCVFRHIGTVKIQISQQRHTAW